MTTTGAGRGRPRAGRSRRRRSAGPSAPSAAGIVVGGRRPVAAAMAGGQPPPAAVEVDQDLLDRVARLGQRRPRWPCPTRSTRRARPTARRAGPRPAGEPAVIAASGLASRPSRRGTRSRTASSTPCRARDLGPDVLGQPADVGRRPLLVVDDEVGVLLGHDGAADPQALEPGGVDQPPGRVARRVAEDAAGRRQPERLVRLPPAPDLVEPLLDRRPARPARGGTSPRGRARAARPGDACLSRLSR